MASVPRRDSLWEIEHLSSTTMRNQVRTLSQRIQLTTLLESTLPQTTTTTSPIATISPMATASPTLTISQMATISLAMATMRDLAQMEEDQIKAAQWG